MLSDILTAIHLYIKYVIPILAIVGIPYLIYTYVKETRIRNEAAQALADRLGVSVKVAKRLMFHDPI